MRISTRGRYGLRAMVDMALSSQDGPIPLRAIAERQGISDSYLEQVFTSLRKYGLVTAARGAQGGYELVRPPDQITVKDILAALEGPVILVHCNTDQSECERESFCPTRSFWVELRDVINDFLSATTLQDLADRATADEPLMYYI